MTYDLVIRDASLDGTADLVDIGVQGTEIAEIGTTIAPGEDEIDAEGNLVAPGFVDAHLHIDRAFAATGDRLPRGSEASSGTGYNELFDEYYEETSIAEIEDRAVENIEKAVEFGSTYLRSHVAVDHPPGTGTMAACLRARERTAAIADIQLVPWCARGILHGDNVESMREAIRMGLDDGARVLVGGVDPATRNHDVERTIDAWLDLAAEFDIGVDPHIQDGGTLGTYTLERLLDKAEARGLADRLTASHCFCLGHVQEWRFDELAARLRETGTGVVTCYSSTRCDWPLRSLLEGDVPIAHGTDNDQDFVALHGRTDSIEGLIVEANKLHGDATFDEDYRWFQTNQGLGLLWQMLTERGAEVLGIDGYGIEEGTPADLVVLDEPSAQWAIVDHATREYVVKGGHVVADGGDLRPADER